jgi:hypothetical protein
MQPILTRLLLAAAGVAALTGLAAAEEAGDAVRKITLHPAAEPRPALKYLFVVPVRDRWPGNAAILYNRIPAERSTLFVRPTAFWEKLEKWREAPLAELRAKEPAAGDARSAELRETMQQIQPVVADLETAARYESVDWQHPIHHQPFFSQNLSELQQARTYARLLTPYVRWQIANRQYDDAVRSLRGGYALGRNLGQGPFLVQGLVGVSVVGLVNQQVETLIQQPDAPNLYWALNSLSRPVVDFRPALEAEMDAVYLSIPELRDLDKKQEPPEYWQALLNRTTDIFKNVGVDIREPRATVSPQLLTTARILEGYPRARQFLIERGRTEAEVDAMPVAQVVLLHTMLFFDELRDELFKWQFTPYPEARRGVEQFETRLQRVAAAREEIVPIGTMLLPAIGSARLAEARIDRDFAALQILEALRLYAAAHDGRLPDRLVEITEVPVPQDPLNGQPFIYRRQGNTAWLESLAPQNFASLRYEIQMQPKGTPQ